MESEKQAIQEKYWKRTHAVCYGEIRRSMDELAEMEPKPMRLSFAALLNRLENCHAAQPFFRTLDEHLGRIEQGLAGRLGMDDQGEQVRRWQEEEARELGKLWGAIGADAAQMPAIERMQESTAPDDAPAYDPEACGELLSAVREAKKKLESIAEDSGIASVLPLGESAQEEQPQEMIEQLVQNAEEEYDLLFGQTCDALINLFWQCVQYLSEAVNALCGLPQADRRAQAQYVLAREWMAGCNQAFEVELDRIYASGADMLRVYAQAEEAIKPINRAAV
ncbi:MAG: hypothetical protein Q4F18_12690 [Clostridia bacterium]|nr:hypothetical protein [Clostridia bacterium]